MKKIILLFIAVIGIMVMTCYSVSIHVSNDNDPYIITNKLSITKGREHIEELIEVQSFDDYQVNVDMSGVDINKKGTYYANVIVKTNHTMISKIIEIEVIDKVVYLTFDDGPSKNTQDILDILDRYHIKATFFVTADNRNYKHMIKEAYEKGHTIGLHAYSHDYSSLYASTDSYFNDLKNISDYVENIIGEKSYYIRFPGGSSNTISRKYNRGIMTQLCYLVKNRGYEYYDWNITSGDAEKTHQSRDVIIKKSTTIPYDDDYLVILFHDSSTKKTTVESLDSIIQYYIMQGYTFRNIDKSSYVYHQPIYN